MDYVSLSVGQWLIRGMEIANVLRLVITISNIIK